MATQIVYLINVLLLIWVPNWGYSQIPPIINCKPQSWREFDNTEPTYSGENTAERKQKYCEVAVKELRGCFQSRSIVFNHHVLDQQDKLNKRINRYEIKNERKIERIKRKYCSNTT